MALRIELRMTNWKTKVNVLCLKMMKKILSFLFVIFLGFFILSHKPVLANDAPFCSNTTHLCQCCPDGKICFPGQPQVYKCCLNTIIGEAIGVSVCTGSEDNLVPFNPPAKPWDLSSKLTCAGGNGVDTAIGCVPVGGPDGLTNFLKFILKFAFFASGGIIVLMVIATGYTIITSQGNPEKLQAAKENIVALLSGLAMIAFSLILLQVIGANILGLPTF